jgi:DNA-binding transcriptional LysR family regulator
LEAYGYTPARILEFGSREAALLAIEAGLGIAPVSLEEVPANADLAVLRCVDFRTFGEVHLACLRARRHLPIVQRVFEEVGTGESLDAAAAEGQPFGEARPNSTT